MPVTKSAKKAWRRGKKRQKENQKILGELRTKIKAARKTKTAEAIRLAVSFLDRAAKRKVIHRNRAARLKSRLAKLLPRKTATKKKKV